MVNSTLRYSNVHRSNFGCNHVHHSIILVIQTHTIYMTTPNTTPSPTQRAFWQKVEKTESGCWNWTAATTVGYGRFSVKRKLVMAHRFSYEQVHGKIPPHLTVDHLCKNKLCVNPAHLEIVTRGENARRHMLALEGCKNGHKWTPENTHFDPRGRRICRECKRLQWHKQKAKKGN